MNIELRDRIAAIRFYDIVKLAKQANGGRTLGIDVNRAFKGHTGGTKLGFAEWCLAKLPEAKLLEYLPPYEATAKAYYGGQTAPRVTKAAPQPTNPNKGQTMPATQTERDAAQTVADVLNPAPVAPTAAHTPDTLPNDDADALAELIKRLAGGSVNADAVAAICAEQIKQALAGLGALPTRVELVQAGQPAVLLDGVHHKTFPDLLRACNTKDPRSGQVFPIWLPGPAGSGKTTAGQNVAKALSRDFYAFGSVKNKYELLGFRDATGECKPTTFRLAYEKGGVCLADEIDDSGPDALPCMNSAIENGFCAFPDGVIRMHPDFILIAAANTYGSGATHEYVGRNKLDAATVDRFTMLDWDYDEALELALSSNAQWTRKVQAIRRAVRQAGIKHVVSPRASIRGSEYLAQGFSEAQVLNMCVYKGLSAEQRSVINNNLR